MVKNKYQKNINLLIIFSIFLFLLPICYNKQIVEHKKKYNNKSSKIHAPSDRKTDDPDRKKDDPERRTDIPEELIQEIEAAKIHKNDLEIESQQKKIYVIALAVLSAIFLILLIIYPIFKCYLFCLLNKESTTPYRRIRISKLGQVYLEENFVPNKSEINNDNSTVNNDNNENNNDAPTCFSVNQKKGTFDPDNFEESNNFYKPVNNENN